MRFFVFIYVVFLFVIHVKSGTFHSSVQKVEVNLDSELETVSNSTRNVSSNSRPKSDLNSKHIKPFETSLGFTNDINVKEKVFIDHFISLPAELKLMILKNLSPEKLFEFIQSEDFESYNNLALEAYGSSFGAVSVCAKDSSRSDFFFEENMINFHNSTNLSSFMETFHKYIRSLKIDFSIFIDQSNAITILDHLKHNCSKSLTRLEIRNTNKKELKIISNMFFPIVNELSVVGCFIHDYDLEFKKKFPAVRRLSVIFSQYSDESWIQKNFWNLTHLQIHVGGNEEVETILKQNPELNSLGLFHFTPDLLRNINENYPSIVNLGLNSFSDDLMGNAEIHMKYVENVFFEGTSHVRVPILFENLKQLHWISLTYPGRALQEFIDRHKNTIETLHIEDGLFSYAHLLRMNLPKLKRFSFRPVQKTRTVTFSDCVLGFIKVHENLQEFQLLGIEQALRQNLYEGFNLDDFSNWMIMDSAILRESSNNDKTNIFLKKVSNEHVSEAEYPLEFFKENMY